jgi:hypothetical protein
VTGSGLLFGGQDPAAVFFLVCGGLLRFVDDIFFNNLYYRIDYFIFQK